VQNFAFYDSSDNSAGVLTSDDIYCNYHMQLGMTWSPSGTPVAASHSATNYVYRAQDMTNSGAFSVLSIDNNDEGVKDFKVTVSNPTYFLNTVEFDVKVTIDPDCKTETITSVPITPSFDYTICAAAKR